MQAGDLVYGYTEGISVYIADSAGLSFWDFELYLGLQEQGRLRSIPLKEAYRSGL